MNYKPFIDWVRLVTGLDAQHVIRANQEGPRPSRPYVTVYLTNDETDRNPTKSRARKPWAGPGPDPNPLIRLTYSHHKNLVLQVNAYSDSGDDLLSDLGMSDNLWAVRKSLLAEGLALAGKGQTRDLTRFEDTRHVIRFLADFEFLAYDENKEDVEEILEWETSGEME